MNLIWYNPDDNEYKFGNRQEFNLETSSSTNAEAYKILKKFGKNSRRTAIKVLHQLNLINKG